MTVIFIIAAVILYGYAEGALPYHKALDKLKIKFLPELLLAVLVAYAWFSILGWWSLLAGAAFYFGIQSGTVDLLPWVKMGVRDINRKPTLRPLVLWLAHKLNIIWDTPAYVYLYATVRGFLSTLPSGGLGALYEPLSREIGYRVNSHTTTALIMGFFYGLNIWGVSCL